MVENSARPRFTAGHPRYGGRRKGTKNQLTTDFIAALCADFRKHGASVIETVRLENPTDYIKLLALLVAKWGESVGVAGPTVVNVTTGWKAKELNVDTGVPRAPDGPTPWLNRPLLPDGRDPFEEHGSNALPRQTSHGHSQDITVAYRNRPDGSNHIATPSVRFDPNSFPGQAASPEPSRAANEEALRELSLTPREVAQMARQNAEEGDD